MKEGGTNESMCASALNVHLEEPVQGVDSFVSRWLQNDKIADTRSRIYRARFWLLNPLTKFKNLFRLIYKIYDSLYVYPCLSDVDSGGKWMFFFTDMCRKNIKINKSYDNI